MIEPTELLPALSGLVLGALLGRLRPALRAPAAAVLALAFGALAAFVSGELRVSPVFFAVDVLIVASAAVLGVALGRSSARRRAG